jgi:hypothetical protein
VNHGEVFEVGEVGSLGPVRFRDFSHLIAEIKKAHFWPFSQKGQ